MGREERLTSGDAQGSFLVRVKEKGGIMRDAREGTWLNCSPHCTGPMNPFYIYRKLKLKERGNYGGTKLRLPKVSRRGETQLAPEGGIPSRRQQSHRLPSSGFRSSVPHLPRESQGAAKLQQLSKLPLPTPSTSSSHLQSSRAPCTQHGSVGATVLDAQSCKLQVPGGAEELVSLAGI